MKRFSQVFLFVGMAISGGLSHAAPGYVDSAGGTIVRTGSGDCLHTTRWSIPNAVAECDPEIVAARDKAVVPVAAIEIVLKPIRLQADTLFAFDSDELTADGARILDDLVADLTAEAFQDQKIHITGYADRIGEEDYNLELSERRATAVRNYLVVKGVAAGHIETQGMGMAKPLVECEGERGAELVDCLAPNRRTEIEFSAMEAVEVQKEVPVAE